MGCIGSIICPPHKQEDKGTGQSMYKQLRLLHEQIYSKAQTAEIHPQPRSQSKQVKPANKKPYNQHQRFQQHTHANRSNPVPKENYEVTERNPRKSREHRKYSSRKKTYQRPKIQGPGQSPYGGCEYARTEPRQIQQTSTYSNYNMFASSNTETIKKSSTPTTIPQASSSSYSAYSGYGYTRPSTETVKQSYNPTSLPAKTESRAYSYYESSNSSEYKLPAARVSSHLSKKESKVKAPDFVPYEGCLGRWVPAGQFLGKGSSFGFYKCESCHKTWMSARSKKEFKQACKACNGYYLPAYLWQNDSKNYEKKEKALVDNLKNHRSDLCEACQKGSCALNRSNNYSTSDYTAAKTRNYEREDYHYDDYYD